MEIEDHLLKGIKFLKSPNFNNRPIEEEIKLIIIHSISLPPKMYGNTYVEDFFMNKLNISDHDYFNEIKDLKVSSHIYIKRDGEIIQFVPFNKRAWHAGESTYRGMRDCNNYSIGIELDYNPEGKNNKFSFKMIVSLKKLIFKLKKKYEINKNNILAHSDIAPFRKKDPGKHFPWKSLYSSNLVICLKNIKKNENKIMEKWFSNYNLKSKKQKTILALSLIGYDTREVYKNAKLYNKLIRAYRIRYLNNEDINKNKSIYNTLIKHLFNYMLTKN